MIEKDIGQSRFSTVSESELQKHNLKSCHNCTSAPNLWVLTEGQYWTQDAGKHKTLTKLIALTLAFRKKEDPKLAYITWNKKQKALEAPLALDN